MQAREKRAQKRGAGGERITLDETMVSTEAANTDDLIALDAVLHRLAELDSRQAHIVELRFYAD